MCLMPDCAHCVVGLFHVSRSVRFTYRVRRTLYAFSIISEICSTLRTHWLFLFRISTSFFALAHRWSFGTTIGMILLDECFTVGSHKGSKYTDCQAHRKRHKNPKTSGQSVVKIMRNMASISQRSHLLVKNQRKGGQKRWKFILLLPVEPKKKRNYFSCRNCSIRRINGPLESINPRISHFCAESRKM